MPIENTSNLCEYMFSNCGRTGICFYAIPSTVKVENGSPDGNGGLELHAKVHLKIMVCLLFFHMVKLCI